MQGDGTWIRYETFGRGRQYLDTIEPAQRSEQVGLGGGVGQMQPINENQDPDALKFCGHPAEGRQTRSLLEILVINRPAKADEELIELVQDKTQVLGLIAVEGQADAISEAGAAFLGDLCKQDRFA
ncbi:hypothetical protein GCM10017673_14010 [Streptosporangium violaceochromogenes]|nr:hypothetical protein GCM10017673_14010 [Streptosporangium violaceochromogenes]